MRLLAIIGSPRKGNTLSVVKKLEIEMKKLGDIDFKYLYLKDLNLESCRGCLNCILKGEEYCPLKDDRDVIIKEMERCDGIIFASPVYVMNVSALMKNFIDHLGYLFHRPRFWGKNAMIISTVAGFGLKSVFDYLELVSRGLGFNLINKLGLTTPPLPISEKMKKKDNEKIKSAAKIFHKSFSKKQQFRPSLGDLIIFRIFRTLSLNFKEILSGDYTHYKERGWLKSKYFIKTRINPIRRFLASFIEKIINWQIKKSYKLL